MKVSTLPGPTLLFIVLLVGYGCSSNSGDGTATVDNGSNPGGPIAAVYDDIGTGYNASVTGGFDLNGDGVDDIALGTYRFDWIAQSAERRTYVVFGSAARSTGVLNLATLDGIDGLLISSAPQPYSLAPDRVSKVGDTDADGHVDLALIGDDGAGYVVYSSQSIGGTSVERENLPSDAATQVMDSSSDSTIVFLRAVGDLDGDGADEIGVELNTGQAAIIYGNADQRLSSVDLAAPGNMDVTRLSGGGDSLSVGDAHPLVSLGDIDSDVIDDLGWGWVGRTYNGGITEITDINDDGVNDLLVGEPMGGNVSLLRVLYGFGQSGFTGVLASAQGPAPIARVEENYYAQLLSAMDEAARVALDQINSTLSSGTSPGPVATACLEGSSGVDTADVQRFSCADTPLAFSFDWGGGKYSGSAESRFMAVSRENDTLQQLYYRSFPLPTGNPGSNPFQAHVTYHADATLKRESGCANTEGCSIDPQSYQTLDKPDTCSYLVSAATRGLADVFRPDSVVRNLQIVR